MGQLTGDSELANHLFMDSTSHSLLRRLQSDDREIAWERFVDLYAPLIFHWGKHHGLSVTDAADLVQEVLTTLVSQLPQFNYDPKQRFRGWLRTVTLNRANDFHRRNALRPADGMSETIDGVAIASEIDLFDQAEYANYLVCRAMQIIKTEFSEHHWTACWELVANGRSGKEIAAELGITQSAVYVAKCRIMKRLRTELDGLLE